MIYVGIDDTDTLDSRGTNQLAKALARAVAAEFVCQRIVRHQLLEDSRVPCTSKNGSASMVLDYRGKEHLRAHHDLTNTLRQLMQRNFVLGSDPGLCVATEVDVEIVEFAKRCQRELVNQKQARQLAAAHGMFLEGLGGTNDGVIGALAAVGFAAANDGGRVVQWEQWPDDLSGWQPIEALWHRRIEVRQLDSSEPIESGHVDVGKHLRPNWHAGNCVLFAVADTTAASNRPQWKAVRLP